MTAADRLAEAARHPRIWHNSTLYAWENYAVHVQAVTDAIAAYDADAERRQVERDVIAAAKAWHRCDCEPYCVGMQMHTRLLADAVRRLREFDK